MSLILDALSRAERDRRREEGPAPDLLADHGVVSRPSAVSRSQALFVAVLIAVVTGAALWLLLHDGQEGTDEIAARGSAGQSAPSPSPAPPRTRTSGLSAADSRASVADSTEPPRSAPAPTAVDPGRAVAAPASGSVSPAEIASLYERRRERVSETITGAYDDGGPAAAAVSADRTAEAAQAEPRPGTEAAARVEEPVDLERALRRARSEAAASRLSEHPVPLLQSLTKQYRDRVPTLMYLRHDYNPVGTSVVLINGQTLSVGDRSSGVEVREILADSVILRFEEREFRLRALNSWVNL